MMKTYRVTVAVAALVALSGCVIFKGSVKKTPTLGRERGFFQELFGNIGAVRAPVPGGGGPGQ